MGKESACNAGDPGPIPGSGRSPGEGNGYPLQYSCLENPMDRGAWRATVLGVAESRTRREAGGGGSWLELLEAVSMSLTAKTAKLRSLQNKVYFPH